MRGVRTTGRTVSGVSNDYRDGRLELQSAAMLLQGARWDIRADPRYTNRGTPTTRLLFDILKRGLRDAGFGYAPFQSYKTLSDRCFVECHDPRGPRPKNSDVRRTNFYLILMWQAYPADTFMSVGYEVDDLDVSSRLEDILELPELIQNARQRRLRA